MPTNQPLKDANLAESVSMYFEGMQSIVFRHVKIVLPAERWNTEKHILKTEARTYRLILYVAIRLGF